jgi:hypothetical protein
MPMTLKFEEAAATPSGTPIPTEKTLDHGEVIVPTPAFDVMDQIISMGESASKTEVSSNTATLIIGAILIYFLIKIVFRFLPWFLAIVAIVLFLKMQGNA